MTRLLSPVACAVVLALLSCAAAYDNGLAALPPMGWNTWCTDDICGLIDRCYAHEIKSVADAMVAQGLDKLGYQYVNMDDCWSATSRDSNGQLQPDPKRFPLGMKELADYVHSKGLKIGLYTCVGTLTCKFGRPGSYGHFDDDARTLAAWGIDFVKADNCHHAPGTDTRELYTNFSRALNATGRPMLFSLCEWGNDDVVEWGGELGQMFRIQMDHLPAWHFPPKAAGQGFGQGTGDIIEYMASLKPSNYTQRHAWMDPDFLMTDFALLSPRDSRTEFSFWSLWSSPLIVTSDVRGLFGHRKETLTNPEVIAVNQDSLATAGDRVSFNNETGAQVWSKPLANGDTAVLLYNSHDRHTIDVSCTWQQFSITTAALVRDMWLRKDLGRVPAGFSSKLAPHEVAFLRVTPSP